VEIQARGIYAASMCGVPVRLGKSNAARLLDGEAA